MQIVAAWIWEVISPVKVNVQVVLSVGLQSVSYTHLTLPTILLV